MKKLYISLTLTSIFLISCASVSNNKYNGSSFAFGGDNILRDDIMSYIVKSERYSNATPCNDIQRVDASIRNPGQRKNNLLTGINEWWIVTACGKKVNYEVKMDEDPNGGVNFTVGKRP